MERKTVVVVEDDDNIADLLDLYLDQAGYDVARAANGADGLALVAEREPAIAIVDIGLPGGIDGLEVCRRMRRDGSVPVLMLSARGEETDRIIGLEIGADDYVTKPFSPRELVARIKAILRRTADDESAAAGPLVLGDVTVDLGRHVVTRSGEPVDLAPREYDLLVVLLENRGLVLSRRQLLDLGWGYDWYGDERTVDVHVAQLRRKLGKDFPLITLRRSGYRLG
ncbi:MAG TPA: response regulator transcription factor [Acidimicrobiales bacterium]|nr:response regulator transcription factor [Acidimicrobiales bacterium]